MYGLDESVAPSQRDLHVIYCTFPSLHDLCRHVCCQVQPERESEYIKKKKEKWWWEEDAEGRNGKKNKTSFCQRFGIFFLCENARSCWKNKASKRKKKLFSLSSLFRKTTTAGVLQKLAKKKKHWHGTRMWFFYTNFLTRNERRGMEEKAE